MFKQILTRVGAAVFLSVALFSAPSALTVAPANAQISIEIGISTAKAIRAMQAAGYTQIKIIKKGFSSVEAHACKDGRKYRVRVADGYRVRATQELGFCRNTVSIEAIEEFLRKRGYTRIVMENQNEKYVALACLGDARIRLVFDRQGQLLQERQVGSCRAELEPNDIRQILRDQGYNRITFTDRQLPRYVAEACREGVRYELVINRFGEIRKSKRIGKCTRPIDPDQLTRILKDRGYNRIEIIDNTPPVYSAQACFNADRVSLEIDRYGTITSRRVIASCRTEIGEEEIVELLEQEGFSWIRVERLRNGQFRVEACLGNVKKIATLSRYGELIDEVDAGKCTPPSVADIYDQLSKRGFKNMSFYVEGCRKGRKIRIIYDRNGQRTGRERIGSC